MQKKYKIKEISFYDDTFTAFRENVKEFCERIIRGKNDITWSCMSRVDFVDSDLLRLMKRAGCHQIGYGIESSSQEILKNIRKPMPMELTKEKIKLTKDFGIDGTAMFMLGNPGETEETLKETINFAISLNPDLAIFNIVTPFPGTEMYNWAKKNNYLLDMEWHEFDLASVVMRLPTITAEKIQYYYKFAYKSFYMRPAYLFKRIYKMKSLIDLRNNIKSLRSILAFGRE